MLVIKLNKIYRSRRSSFPSLRGDEIFWLFNSDAEIYPVLSNNKLNKLK